jgi:hypothetical protein
MILIHHGLINYNARFYILLIYSYLQDGLQTITYVTVLNLYTLYNF